MATTINEIAEKCGVSRGTVDRVLHNRGGVSASTRKLVLETAHKMGYENNILGQALASRKKVRTIGIILCSLENVFFDDLIKGITDGLQENSAFSIEVINRYMKGYDVEKQLQLIKEIGEQADFLIINAIDDARIVGAINMLVDNGVGVLTVNTDVSDSKRLEYIGADYFECGQIACGLIALLCGKHANVLILTGSLSLLEHRGRIRGFKQQIQKKYPNIKVEQILEHQDDEDKAYQATLSYLKKNNSVDAIFIGAAGTKGVCKALAELKMTSIPVVACDSYPDVIRGMEKNIIDATIVQQPYLQGKMAIIAAIEYVVYGQIREHIKIHNNILIYENRFNK